MKTMTPSGQVPIALLYQSEALHQHLKQALTELGADVVYDSPAASFDRGALTRSGAEVVVINLDPGVEREIDHLGELLADDSVRVVFNDAEVSSRLEGSDHARWARHLAAKILGHDEINPPRPPGAEAVPVRVQAAGPEYVGQSIVDKPFEIAGEELARALAADTGESLQRTRAALVTKDDVVAAEIVARYDSGSDARLIGLEPASDAASAPPPASAPGESPTLEIPREEIERAKAFRDRAPTLEIPRAELEQALAFRDHAPTLEIPREELERARAFRADAPTLELPADELARARAFRDEAPTLELELESIEQTFVPQPIDDGTPAPDAAPAASPGSAAPTLEPPQRPSADAAPAPSAPRAAAPLDPELAANLADFGLVDAATPAAAPASADDDFAAALGALELVPLDEPAAAPAPSRDAEPAPGLDELLRGFDPGLAPLTAPAAARPEAAAPAPPATEARPRTDSAIGRAASGTPAPEAPSRVAVRDFSTIDLSHLSLAPLDGEPAERPAGRASFTLGQQASGPKAVAERAPPPVGASAKPAAAAPPESFDVDLGGLSIDRLPDKAPATAPDDLIAELEALAAGEIAFEAPIDTPAGGAVERVWVLGASIGGPEAVREFVGALPADIGALFVLVQHMGAEFVELMTQQLAKATRLKVRAAGSGIRVAHGEVLVVPLDARVQVGRDGRVEVEAPPPALPYNPSIDLALRDVADRYGAAAGAIIFSGMAHDAVEGARHLVARGGTVWAQDPASCVISSMVDGARAAGLVSFVGTPAELARRFVMEYGA